jgi:coatomer subunit beta
VKKAVFGEDALANVSAEKKDDNDGKLAVYIHIRSGAELSLSFWTTALLRRRSCRPEGE